MVVIHNAARILYANQRMAALLGIVDARKLVGQTPLFFASFNTNVWRGVLYCKGLSLSMQIYTGSELDGARGGCL